MQLINIEDIIPELPKDVQDILTQSYGNVTEATFSDLNAEVNQISTESKLQPITQQDLENLANTFDVSFVHPMAGQDSSTEDSVIVEEQTISEQQLVELQAPLALSESIVEFPELVIEEIPKAVEVVVVESVKENIYSREAILALGVKDHALRFSEASWYSELKNMNVTLVGAGGISSWCGVMLAKLNLNSLTIFDGDNYDVSNIAGQLFLHKHMYENKAVALKDLCKSVNPYVNAFSYGSYLLVNPSGRTEGNASHGIKPIMFIGVDNMEARKAIFDAWWSKYSGRNELGLFIDGRLAAESYQLYTIRNDDDVAKDRYLAEWFPSEKGDELSCSYKQTSFVAANLASRMVTHFVNSFINEDAIPRMVPFYVEVTPYYEKIINYAAE